MERAIKILDILYTIAAGVASIIGIIVGFVCLGHAGELANEMVRSNPQLALQDAEAIVASMVVYMLVLGFYFIGAFVMGFVIYVNVDKDISKGKGIAIGVVGTVFGSVAGVLFIIDSAINR